MDIKGSRINKFQAVFFGIALSYKIRANQSRRENNDDVDDVSPGIIRACIWGPYGALPLAPLSVLAGHCVRLSYCLPRPIIIIVVVIIVIIIITRPKPAYGRQGLAGSWGQDTDAVSTFLVFLTSHFAPAALSSDLNQPWSIKIHLES